VRKVKEKGLDGRVENKQLFGFDGPTKVKQKQVINEGDRLINRGNSLVGGDDENKWRQSCVLSNEVSLDVYLFKRLPERSSELIQIQRALLSIAFHYSPAKFNVKN